MRFRVLRSLLGMDALRWWLAFRCPPGPLKDYYRADTPTLDTPHARAGFLAIDLETTGLDPLADEIVSIGFAPIDNGRLRLIGAGSFLVKPSRPMSENAARVHGLLDRHLEEAPALSSVLPKILMALTGRLPVAHHAQVEREFLTQACRRVYGYPLEVPFVDTMALERRSLERMGRPIRAGDLKLGACRDRHGLPRYRAHDALADAVAAGELFLALAAKIGGRKPAELRDLLS